MRKDELFMSNTKNCCIDGLEILDEMTDEELLVLRDIYLKKGGITCNLDSYSDYRANPDRPSTYTHLLRRELKEYGSNTFSFGCNSYKEILIKVCEKMKVNFNSQQSIEHIEHNLLEKVLADSWEKMSNADKENILQQTGQTGSMKGASSLVLLQVFRAGGFASYQLAVVIANIIAKMVLNRGLSLAANAALTRVLSVFAGPVGIAITALWTIVDIAGPAYRVIIPAVIYIATMRHAHSNKAYKDLKF